MVGLSQDKLPCVPLVMLRLYLFRHTTIVSSRNQHKSRACRWVTAERRSAWPIVFRSINKHVSIVVFVWICVPCAAWIWPTGLRGRSHQPELPGRLRRCVHQQLESSRRAVDHVVVAAGCSAGNRLVVCAGYEECQSQHGAAVGEGGSQTNICCALRLRWLLGISVQK